METKAIKKDLEIIQLEKKLIELAKVMTARKIDWTSLCFDNEDSRHVPKRQDQAMVFL